MSKSLSFRKDGTFTIVQFTDLHWMDGRPEDQRTREIMERVMDAEKPDLVVITGDVIYTGPVSPGKKNASIPGKPSGMRSLPWKNAASRGRSSSAIMIRKTGSAGTN